MADLTIEHTETSAGPRDIEYRGEALRHVAMPLGGLGAGQIALGGDGGLRQWQMVPTNAGPARNTLCAFWRV